MSYSFSQPGRTATLVAAASSSSVVAPLFVAVAALLAAIYVGVGSFATMIIVLGAGITLLSTPLANAAWRSQLARARLAPKLDELKRQHRNDSKRFAEESSLLFEQHGISPWTGCLPAAVSGLIYFSVYRALKGLTNKPAGSRFIQPRYVPHSSRLFHVLASSTAVNSWGVNLATTGVAAIQLSATSAGLFLAVVAVAVAAGIWQQHLIKAALPRPSGSSSSAANRLSTLVPALFAASALVLPLAVSIYYASASLIRLVQQWAIIRSHPF
jgi:YidC/Oxa1 family membrane protein insertase